MQKPLLSSVLLVVFAALGAIGSPSAVAGVLTCGPQPAVADQVKSDTKAKAMLILRAPANSNIRGLIGAERHALWEKFADVESPEIDRYLLWVTCETLSDDPAQTTTEKFDKYADLYRLLSEPIKAPSHPE